MSTEDQQEAAELQAEIQAAMRDAGVDLAPHCEAIRALSERIDLDPDCLRTASVADLAIVQKCMLFTWLFCMSGQLHGAQNALNYENN